MNVVSATYRFALLKVHPRLELTGWYLVVNDMDTVMEIHRSAAQSMFLKFGRDPHLYNQQTGAPVCRHRADLFNPVKLSAGWLTTAEKAMSQYGVIYVNYNHGIFFGKNVEILEERESNELRFPIEESQKDGVWITISRFGGGNHYYLRASAGAPVFSQPKFNTEEEARTEALRHAHSAHIRVESARPYFRDGD